MRLWSIHPLYLDRAGLVAAWREALLAKAVLSGKTKGYKNHSQLDRFKECIDPVNAINCYLQTLYDESLERGYKFDKSKIDTFKSCNMPVTTGQLEYEFKHIMNKLAIREDIKFRNNLSLIRKHGKKEGVLHNPMFNVVEGSVESWEKVKSN